MPDTTDEAPTAELFRDAHQAKDLGRLLELLNEEVEGCGLGRRWDGSESAGLLLARVLAHVDALEHAPALRGAAGWVLPFTAQVSRHPVHAAYRLRVDCAGTVWLLVLLLETDSDAALFEDLVDVAGRW